MQQKKGKNFDNKQCFIAILNLVSGCIYNWPLMVKPRFSLCSSCELQCRDIYGRFLAEHEDACRFRQAAFWAESQLCLAASYITEYTTGLHWYALCCTVLHCTILHCTTLYWTVLHCTALHCCAHYNPLHLLYCKAEYRLNPLYSPVRTGGIRAGLFETRPWVRQRPLYCITLYCTVHHCTVLHNIVLKLYTAALH